MKLGILLIIIGIVVMTWWGVVPITLILLRLPSEGLSVNWGTLGLSLAIALFGGALPFTIGQEQIKKHKAKKDDK